MELIQLTEAQITFIRKHLTKILDNLDFIEEMTDHFILDIERQLNEGIDIQTAFLATKNSFGNADGLQELEKSFVKNFKKGIYNEMKEMYLQTLLKTTNNVLLVLSCITLYYFLFTNMIFHEVNIGQIIVVGAMIVWCIFYQIKTWKYNSFQYSTIQDSTQVGKTILGRISGITILYFQLHNQLFKQCDNFFLNILFVLIFVNFILWSHFSIKILQKMQKNKIITA